MAKIQEIKRQSGTTVNHITIPKEAMEISQLQKGDEVEVNALGPGRLEIKKVN